MSTEKASVEKTPHQVWLKKLKVGDRVSQVYQGSVKIVEITYVDRKAMCVAGGVYFRKNGQAEFGSSIIREPTKHETMVDWLRKNITFNSPPAVIEGAYYGAEDAGKSPLEADPSDSAASHLRGARADAASRREPRTQ